MHLSMSFEYTGDANADFARGMIPHHLGALDMCHVLQRARERHSELDELCGRILHAQSLEISELSTWLKVNGHGHTRTCSGRGATRDCAVQPPAEWGCGDPSCAVGARLLEVRTSLQHHLALRYSCIQRYDAAMTLEVVHSALNQTCSVLRTAGPLGSAAGALTAACDALTATAAEWMPALHGVKYAAAWDAYVGSRRLAGEGVGGAVGEGGGEPRGRGPRALFDLARPAGPTAAGESCDVSIDMDAVRNGASHFLAGYTPAYGGAADPRLWNGVYASVGCGDPMCISARASAELSAATLATLAFNFTCDGPTDIGRTLRVLLEDTLGRCALVAAPLDAGLPQIATSIRLPLLSPGPYDVGDARLHEFCAIVNQSYATHLDAIVSALDGSAPAAGLQPPPAAPPPGAPFGALPAAMLASWRESMRCPAGQCTVRSVFLGCGAVDGCNATWALMDALWAECVVGRTRCPRCVP